MSRTNIVRASILVLLIVILFIVGVLWYLSSSEEPKSLEIIPQIEGKSLIQFASTDKDKVKTITSAIEDALKPYNESNPTVFNCDFDHRAPNGYTCDVDLKTFGSCSGEQSFGYRRSSPCVFLKLAKKPDWIPQFLNETNLPESMPEDFKQIIRASLSYNPNNAQMVWVSCDGKDSADRENLGPINYYPRRGFPGYYFPCTSKDRCNQPLVAVKFERPKAYVTINVQCKIWAQNLEDSVDFQLLVE